MLAGVGLLPIENYCSANIAFGPIGLLRSRGLAP
jgi:hypothetical protein